MTSIFDTETCDSTAPFTPASKRQTLNLGAIGNCSFSALVDRTASVVWCPMPHFDGDPVFCSLLRGGKETCEPVDKSGTFDVELHGLSTSRQYYLRNTAVLVTELRDDAGNEVRVIDFAPRLELYGRMHRPMQIVRIVQPLKGVPRVTIRCAPMHSHGAETPECTRGSNSVRYMVPGMPLRLTADCPVGLIVDPTPFVLDRPISLLLGPDESLSDAPSAIAQRFLVATCGEWRAFTRGLHVPFEWQQPVIRAAITLKLCSFEETGAVIAAMTTSVPEYADSGRCWDYTKTWLRDSYFTVNTLNRLGSTQTMEDYMRFMANIVVKSEDGYLQPLFGISYQHEITEWECPTLTGYRGMGPVRFGNAAYTQVQNDSYGAVILAVTQSFFDERLSVRGGAGLFEHLERLGEQALARFSAPDAGLWELRGSAHTHTFSSVMCWAACDRLGIIAAELARKTAENGQNDGKNEENDGSQPPNSAEFYLQKAAKWRQAASEIQKTTVERAWNPEINAFSDTWGGDDVDACLLLMAELGFVDAMDSRYIGTVEAIEAKLRHGDHLFRYAKADDFGVPETAFNICTFWFISALAKIGRKSEARRMFENILSCRNAVGLLSEDIEVGGEGCEMLWGNFPQTYSMVGIIDCAILLSRPWCTSAACENE